MVQAVPESSPRVLVVDDEVEIVAFIRELLVSQGYQVLGLSNSLEASSKLASFRPDVCVLDFRMPQRTGAELLDIIKQHEPRIEVIILTAQDETRLAVDLM